MPRLLKLLVSIRPEQVLDRQVIQVLGVRLPVAPLGFEPAVDDEIPHGQADAFEHLTGREALPGLRQRVPSVPLDGFAKRGDGRAG